MDTCERLVELPRIALTAQTDRVILYERVRRCGYVVGAETGASLNNDPGWTP
jgi:hypothetical protein